MATKAKTTKLLDIPFSFSLIVAAGIMLAAFALNAKAAEPNRDPNVTEIMVNAEASRAVSNDSIRATISYEYSAATPAEVSKKVNLAMAAILDVLKRRDEIKVQQSSSNTYPVYSQKNQQIQSWRMHSSVVMESKNIILASEIMGNLQSIATVSNIQFFVSPEEAKRIEDYVTADAIDALKKKIEVVNRALQTGSKSSWSISELTVGHNNAMQPMMYGMRKGAVMSMAGAADESMPMPVSAGESRISVNVSAKVISTLHK